MSPNLRDALLWKAKNDPDSWVCRIEYIDCQGRRSRRLISPTLLTRHTVNAICLSREESRNFSLRSIENVELVPAHEAQMPAEIEYL